MPKEVNLLVFRLLGYWVSKAAMQTDRQAGSLSVRTFRMQSQPVHYTRKFWVSFGKLFLNFWAGPYSICILRILRHKIPLTFVPHLFQWASLQKQNSSTDRMAFKTVSSFYTINSRPQQRDNPTQTLYNSTVPLNWLEFIVKKRGQIFKQTFF